MTKGLFLFGGIVGLVMLACSDSGDTPTKPDPADDPAISVGDLSVAEGNSALFAISLDQSADHAVIYVYATASGSATAGSDFIAASGSDTIPAGQVSATVLVATIDDTEVEAAETFSLAFSSVSGATIGRSLAIGTINDNDASQVSYAADVKPLLRTSCGKLATCHGGAFPGGGMFIDTSAAYAYVIAATGQMLTGGLVVVPGNAPASTLYTQTTDDYVLSRMPKGFSPLSLAQQNLIRDWINQGALDN